MFKGITNMIDRAKKKRNLVKLHKQIYHGAIFLRILHDELKNMPRHQKKRFLKSIYKDGKLGLEMIDFCEMKAEHLLKAMQGQLKAYKKKKQAQRKAGKEQVKKATEGAQRIKPNTPIKPELVTVDGKKKEAVDGKEFYDNVKKKEREGKL